MPKCDFSKVFLQSQFDMCVLLEIYCVFSKHLFIRTPLEDCFPSLIKLQVEIHSSIYTKIDVIGIRVPVVHSPTY